LCHLAGTAGSPLLHQPYRRYRAGSRKFFVNKED